jgi:hypothetical protein
VEVWERGKICDFFLEMIVSDGFLIWYSEDMKKYHKDFMVDNLERICFELDKKNGQKQKSSK